MTEKYYMACDSDAEGLKAEYGPFKTSGEAEDNARRLGWTWVCVYIHTVNEAGAVTDVKTRYYEIAPGIAKLRSAISGVKPLNADETKFFAFYEKQLSEPPPLWERIKNGIAKTFDAPDIPFDSMRQPGEW
jgi:hypothetical protein